jgi:hypothetical protein
MLKSRGAGADLDEGVLLLVGSEVNDTQVKLVW